MPLIQPGSLTVIVSVPAGQMALAQPYVMGLSNDNRIAQVLVEEVNNPQFGYQLPLVTLWWQYGRLPLGGGAYNITGQAVGYMQGGPSLAYVRSQIDFVLTWEGIPLEPSGDGMLNLGTDAQAGNGGGFINPWGLYDFYIPGLTEIGAWVSDKLDLRATIWLAATGFAGYKTVSSKQPLLWALAGVVAYSNYRYKKKVEDNWDCINHGTNC